MFALDVIALLAVSVLLLGGMGVSGLLFRTAYTGGVGNGFLWGLRVFFVAYAISFWMVFLTDVFYMQGVIDLMSYSLSRKVVARFIQVVGITALLWGIWTTHRRQ